MRVQRNHVACALRAFLRLERHRLTTSLTLGEFKDDIIRTNLHSRPNCVTPIGDDIENTLCYGGQG